MAKNKQSDYIAIVKVLNIGFIKKHIPNLGIGEGGYSVLLNYQSLASKIFSLVPFLPKHFSLKYKRSRLLHVSFLEL